MKTVIIIFVPWNKMRRVWALMRIKILHSQLFSWKNLCKLPNSIQIFYKNNKVLDIMKETSFLSLTHYIDNNNVHLIIMSIILTWVLFTIICAIIIHECQCAFIRTICELFFLVETLLWIEYHFLLQRVCSDPLISGC